jgi:23S rRNA (pseudouridine1915-N3)-methyltransferase
MKIQLIQIGKTSEDYLLSGISVYERRLKGYIPFASETIPYLKNAASLSQDVVKQKEGGLILSKIKQEDWVVLLDERGKMYSSLEFADQLQSIMNQGLKQIVFIIGGAYGFSPDVYSRANQKVSLSKMTFSHQNIRLIFAEQLYRAYSIINRHPYHHE